MKCPLCKYEPKLKKNGDVKIITAKKKRYIIGVGYPWYSDAFTSFGPQRQTSHGLGCIKLYNQPFTGRKGSKPCDIIMLDPKGTHNGKKYRLILEEV